MAGSVAEERIRAKAEAAMRRRWPGARIIHELQLEQGGIRIDLAAVTEETINLVEIKSERDVLKRLTAQIGRAVEVADEVWIVAAEKHRRPIHELRCKYDDGGAHRALGRARVLIERLDLDGELHSDAEAWGSDHGPDPRARFDLLWRGEQASALGRHFGGASVPSGKMTRARMTALAVEHMTGRELRRAVCAQLRDRTFPRADPRASIAEPVK